MKVFFGKDSILKLNVTFVCPIIFIKNTTICSSLKIIFERRNSGFVASGMSVWYDEQVIWILIFHQNKVNFWREHHIQSSMNYKIMSNLSPTISSLKVIENSFGWTCHDITSKIFRECRAKHESNYTGWLICRGVNFIKNKTRNCPECK